MPRPPPTIKVRAQTAIDNFTDRKLDFMLKEIGRGTSDIVCERPRHGERPRDRIISAPRYRSEWDFPQVTTFFYCRGNGVLFLAYLRGTAVKKNTPARNSHLGRTRGRSTINPADARRARGHQDSLPRRTTAAGHGAWHGVTSTERQCE